MPLVSLSAATVTRHGEELLRDLDLQLEPGDRLVLLGAERRLTALLDLLEGRLQPDQGKVQRAPELRVGRLSRTPEAGEHASLFEAASAGRTELAELKRRIERLKEEVDGGHARAAPGLAELEERYEREGGEDVERRTTEVLHALGFDSSQFSLPLSVLSLGERSRLMLARLMVQAPALLLLEDPTRHLDIPGCELLERYLAGFEGVAVVTSCDRDFFDHFATALLEIQADGRARSYPGSAEEHRRIRAAEGDPAALGVEGFRFPEMEHSAKVLVTARGLAIRPGGQTLLEPTDLQIARGDKVGLIGPQGSGPGELLQVLAGKRAPEAGKVHPGFRLLVGYLGPEGAGPATGRTVLAQLGAERPDLEPAELREQAALFLFPGAEAERRVEELEEADAARLGLMLLVLGHHNTLLLDEPTARLDLRSREVLEQALQAYPGTLVVVSHDRAFLGRVATRILSFEGRSLVDERGSYSELRRAGRVLADFPVSPDVSRLLGRRRRTATPARDAPRAPDEGRRRVELEQRAAELLARVQSLVERMANPAMALDWEGLEALSGEKRGLEREREACLNELQSLRAARE